MVKNERGAIVVEASIAFTTFLFVLFIIYSIMNCCIAQAKMNVAVNCAAKEISQYAYLYSITGIGKLHEDIDAEGKLADSTVHTVVGGIETMYDAIGNAPNSSVTEFSNSGKKAYDDIKSGVDVVLDDPKKFILSCAYSGASDLFNGGLGELGETLAKAMVKKNLVSGKGNSVDAYLKHLGIVPNGTDYFGAISFEGTEILTNNGNNIQIVASFDVSVVRLLNMDVKYHICVCGKTKAWKVS